MRVSRERSFLEALVEEERWRWWWWLCSPWPDGEDLWREPRWPPLPERFLAPCRCEGDRERDRDDTLRLRLCEPCRLELLSLRLSSDLDLTGEEGRARPDSL